MSKINPGSNRNEDNDLRTATTGGLQNVNIPEPKIVDKDKFQCTMCNATFNSREAYLSHALAHHQRAEKMEKPMM